MAKTVTWAQTLQSHKGLLEVLVVQCAKVGVGSGAISAGGGGRQCRRQVRASPGSMQGLAVTRWGCTQFRSKLEQG